MCFHLATQHNYSSCLHSKLSNASPSFTINLIYSPPSPPTCPRTSIRSPAGELGINLVASFRRLHHPNNHLVTVVTSSGQHFFFNSPGGCAPRLPPSFPPGQSLHPFCVASVGYSYNITPFVTMTIKKSIKWQIITEYNLLDLKMWVLPSSLFRFRFFLNNKCDFLFVHVFSIKIKTLFRMTGVYTSVTSN